MSKHKLKKNVFEAIRKELLNTEDQRTQADIAADYQVTSTMVSVVNNARTWPNYQASKTAKHPLRGPLKAVQPSRQHRAEKAGLKPVNAEERRKASAFAADLEKLKTNPTREEFDYENSVTRERLNGQLSLHTKSTERLDRVSTRGFVFGLIAVVALIVAIVK